MTDVDAIRRTIQSRIAQVTEGNGGRDLLKCFAELATGPETVEPVTEAIFDKSERPESKRTLGPYVTPRAVVEFMARVARRLSPRSILDPTCGCGLALRRVVAECSPAAAYGIERDQDAARLASKLLGHDAEILTGDVFTAGSGLSKQFELILADPPLGRRFGSADPDERVGRSGDFAEDLVLWSLRHLTLSGTLMALLPPRAVVSQDLHERVANAGGRIRALVHLPPGTLSATFLPCYIAIVDRQAPRAVFFGQLSKDAEANEQLINNMLAGKTGPHPGLGTFCDVAGLRSFEQLEARQRLKVALKGSSFENVPACKAFKHLERFSGEDNCDLQSGIDGEASVLIGPTGTPVQSEYEIQRLRRNVIRLVPNPEILDSEYLSHWLNSEVGRIALRTLGSWAASPTVTVSGLREATLPLPPLAEQKRVVQAMRRIRCLQAELQSVESECWSGRVLGDDLVRRAETINNPQRYENWIESLPYPLATVLWCHHTANDDPRFKARTMANFFEALAGFLAIIHLSAFFAIDSQRSIWQAELKELLSKRRVDVAVAQFGTWRAINDWLSSRATRMLESEKERPLLLEMYSSPSEGVLKAILSPELRDILERANVLRNQDAHGGAESDHESRKRDAEFITLVERLRGVFGSRWQEYELVIAGSGDYLGGVYQYENLPRAMGTRTPFPKVSIETREPLVKNCLYLLGRGASRGLRILPLVRMVPSARTELNTCVFYNRVEPGGRTLRYVSYHNTEMPEVSDVFADARQVIDSLRLST